MKRSRDQDLEEDIQNLQELTRKIQKKFESLEQPQPQKQAKSEDKDNNFIINEITTKLGDLIKDSEIQVSELANGVRSYSFLIALPSLIGAKERELIKSIDGIISSAVECNSKGIMKLSMIYSNDDKVTLAINSQNIGERINETIEGVGDAFDKKVLQEVQQYIPFEKDCAPVVTEKGVSDGVSLVEYVQKVKSPIKLTQVERINTKIIKDIQILPSVDSTHIRINLQYLKQKPSP
jgi:hypothetical protein